LIIYNILYNNYIIWPPANDILIEN